MTYLGGRSTGLEIATASVTMDPTLASADPVMMASVARVFMSAAHQIQGAGDASSKASAELSANWSGKGRQGFDAASSKVNTGARLAADAMAAASTALSTLSTKISAAQVLANKALGMATKSAQAATVLQSAYEASAEQAVQALPANASYEEALAARAPSAAQVAEANNISGDAAQAMRLMNQADTMARQAWDQAAAAFQAIIATSPTAKAGALTSSVQPHSARPLVLRTPPADQVLRRWINVPTDLHPRQSINVPTEQGPLILVTPPASQVLRRWINVPDEPGPLFNYDNGTAQNAPRNYVRPKGTTGQSGQTGPNIRYENPGHHDPTGGLNPYNRRKAVLPPDAESQFYNSVQVGTVRWTKIGSGRKAVYYRYSNDGNGNWHWSGSTAGVTKRGDRSVIPLDQVPISVQRSRG